MQLRMEVAETSLDKKRSLALAACYRIALERARIVREQQAQQAIAAREPSDPESDTTLDGMAEECTPIETVVPTVEL
jgi:hypothetical protein